MLADVQDEKRRDSLPLATCVTAEKSMCFSDRYRTSRDARNFACGCLWTQRRISATVMMAGYQRYLHRRGRTP